MVQSWYLPCDFHYFILAVFICILIKKNKMYGLIMLGVTTFSTIMAPFIVTAVNDGDPVIYFYPDFLRRPKQHPEFLLSYTKSHTRASPYFIGMIIGYVYYRMRNSDNRLKRVSFFPVIQIICICIFQLHSFSLSLVKNFDFSFILHLVKMLKFSWIHFLLCQ